MKLAGSSKVLTLSVPYTSDFWTSLPAGSKRVSLKFKEKLEKLNDEEDRHHRLVTSSMKYSKSKCLPQLYSFFSSLYFRGATATKLFSRWWWRLGDRFWIIGVLGESWEGRLWPSLSRVFLLLFILLSPSQSNTVLLIVFLSASFLPLLSKFILGIMAVKKWQSRFSLISLTMNLRKNFRSSGITSHAT